MIGNIEYTQATSDPDGAHRLIGHTSNFFTLAELGYNAANNIEYLSKDSLHFQLYLKAELSK